MYQSHGLSIAAIPYDPPPALRRFATTYGVTYPLLSDMGSQVIRRFDILNDNMPEGDPFYGIPFRCV
jgi:peroxiredoxin